MTFEEHEKALVVAMEIMHKAVKALDFAEDEVEFAKENLQRAEEEYEIANNRFNDLLNIDKSTLSDSK